MELNVFKQKLDESGEWLAKEFTGIRTGQAAPALLDSIKVDNYGSMSPLNQVGSIGVEDARTLRVSPWDVSTTAVIEKAIQEADLLIACGMRFDDRVTGDVSTYSPNSKKNTY